MPLPSPKLFAPHPQEVLEMAIACGSGGQVITKRAFFFLSKCLSCNVIVLWNRTKEVFFCSIRIFICSVGVVLVSNFVDLDLYFVVLV